MTQPGRELDARVAEYVMGWRSFDIRLNSSHSVEDLRAVNPEDRLFQRVPEYSTDVAASWLVVEKLRERCAPIEITVYANGKGAWCQSRVDGIGDMGKGADTVAHAICLAALAAFYCMGESAAPPAAEKGE